MSELVNIITVPDGAIVLFPNSLPEYMKVCNSYDRRGGVVDLSCGRLIPCGRLEKEGLGFVCEIINNSFNEYFDEIFYKGMNYDKG